MVLYIPFLRKILFYQVSFNIYARRVNKDDLCAQHFAF
jgi:hypothetical protein